MQDLRLACIVACGKDVKEPMPSGTVCIVQDGFEFIDVEIDIWDKLCECPEFSELAEYQRQTECDIKTQLVFEHSLMAVWEDFKGSDRLTTGQIRAHLSA